MTIKHPLATSEKEARILITLFVYRGMRAKDLAVFETLTYNYSLSDEKSVYNYLAKLKLKGFVKSTRLQGVNSLGSIYYLSSTGLEFVKNLLNISVGQNGNGVLPIAEHTTFWDVPADYQLPPLKQTEHFLQTIEFFKQLVADREEAFTHRTTFYSNLVYFQEQRKQKLKPDAMILVNGNNYAVEIDRATEGHEQLIQKFRKYKEHYDYCQSVEDKANVRPIHTILFVVEERSRRHGIQRRWTNVLSAFFKAFDQKFSEINLILVPMNEVAATLEFESQRKTFEEEQNQRLLETLKDNGFTGSNHSWELSIVKNNENQCLATILQIHQEFESRLYKDKFNLMGKLDNIKNKIKKIEQPADLQYQGGKGFWLSPYNKPKMAEGIENTGLHPEFIEKLKVSFHYFDYYKENQFN